jgi:polar amino acid transport system substrate-binding protein
MRIVFTLLVALLTLSCGGKSKSFDYTIALDPTWFTLELPGRETSITTFTLELIEAIGKAENVSIAVYDRSWSNLTYGLQEGDYDAICSTMQPYLFYDKMYDFSDLYLMTGPVLITPTQSPYKSLDQMAGRVVGIVKGSSDALIVEKYPDIIQISYDTLQDALAATTDGTIDGAMGDIQTTQAFTRDLYYGKLKIATRPLAPEGVRLLSLKNHSPHLIEVFNRGLKHLKSSGKYAELAKKWNLSE